MLAPPEPLSNPGLASTVEVPLSLSTGGRQDLLSALQGGPATAAGLARRLGLPRQRVNYHLRELERAGLVELVEERRRGNCVERLVRATARAFLLGPEALGAQAADPAALDRGSAAYQIAVAARAIREVANLEAAARGEGRRLPILTLDAEVVLPDAASRAAFAAELADALAALVARHRGTRAGAGRRHRLTALFHPLPAGAEAGGRADG